jgi:hypothetical protein
MITVNVCIDISCNSIDQLHYTVTRITTHYYDDGKINPRIIRTGTGFFYYNLQSKSQFLITNRHVICDENYFPNAINLMLHSNMNDMTKNEVYSIHLYNKIKPLWRNPNPPEADAVAIPIDRNDLAIHNIVYISFASNNMLPKDILLDVGEDVFIMGYPLGIYDEVHNLPVIRGGTTSSAYPIPWNGRPYFLVDSNLEEGTSGSPVLTKFKGTWRRTDGRLLNLEPAIFLLGINSSTFPTRGRQERPVGLNAIYFAQVIDEMTA